MRHHRFGIETFHFLEELEAHNERQWFTSNKEIFTQWLEEPFIHLLEETSERLRNAAISLSGGRSTVFRMNRDIRFSADKSPYKTNLSGLLTPSGTKKEAGSIVYLQLDTFGGFAAAGLYGLTPAQLGPIREAMLERADAFQSVKDALKEAGRDLDRSDSLTSMPKGFSEHALHPHAAELRLKSLIVRKNLSREDWLGEKVAGMVAALAGDAMPLLSFAGSDR